MLIMHPKHSKTSKAFPDHPKHSQKTSTTGSVDAHAAKLYRRERIFQCWHTTAAPNGGVRKRSPLDPVVGGVKDRDQQVAEHEERDANVAPEECLEARHHLAVQCAQLSAGKCGSCAPDRIATHRSASCRGPLSSDSARREPKKSTRTPAEPYCTYFGPTVPRVRPCQGGPAARSS